MRFVVVGDIFCLFSFAVIVCFAFLSFFAFFFAFIFFALLFCNCFVHLVVCLTNV